MKTYELVVPCHFGMEAVTKREIYDLGYEITRVEDGRITFEGDAEAICRANVFLRTAERVLLLVGRFKATTFEELFQGIKGLPWEEYIPVDGKFWVKKASSIKSKLFSPSDIQSIAKKAMVERLKGVYKTEWLECDVCGKMFYLDGTEFEPILLCSDCCYLGDKFSFEQPNDLVDIDPNNPAIKHYYCNCGDCDNYRKDITSMGITKCGCFESL